MYERASAVDSGFALADARLSMVNGGMYWGDLDLLLSGFAAGRKSGHYTDPMASVPLMRLDPIWDGVRDHPAFQALLEMYDPLR